MILPNDQPSLYTAYGRGRPPSPIPSVSSELSVRMKDWFDRHPALCVATALSMGVTLGWLLKRR